ncbi:MAG: histidinol-phosphate transaminase [Chloroflexi bacterium]|nr:histidinol-phosphate transaminase [Chloroflexota bacterium]
MEIQDLLKPSMRTLPPYAALEDVNALARELGLDPDTIIKIDGNENAFGPSEHAISAITNSLLNTVHRYGDAEQRALRESIGAHINVSPDAVVCGNGSDELIDLVFRLFVAPGDDILISSPTFGMYSFDASLHGAQVVDVPLGPQWNFDSERLLIEATRSKVVFIPSPNNPTGNSISLKLVTELLAAGSIVVIDEAYIEFSTHESLVQLASATPRLIVLRTFSKWGGLAGLRIGYGVMHPETAQICMQAKQPYNIGIAAEVAALASLEDSDSLDEKAAIIVNERDRLAEEFQSLGWINPWQSDASFLLCRLDGISGLELRDRLRTEGIFTRYIAHPRLEDHLRLSIATPEENNEVLRVLKEIGSE